MQPIYRLTLYAPRAEDPTESTPLVPHSNAPHAESFQVATARGVTGFQPYMDLPRGRRGRIDPLTKKSDTGALTVRILDKRTGTTNDARWVTAFVGDAAGRARMAGRLARFELSTDGGGSWDPYFTGRVREHRTDGRTWIELQVWGLEDSLRRPLFHQRPATSVGYTQSVALWPVGLTEDFGPVKAVPRPPATAKATDTAIGWGPRRTLHFDRNFYPKLGFRADIITADFNRVIGGRENNSRIWIRFGGGSGVEVRCTWGGQPAAYRLIDPIITRKDAEGHLRLTQAGIAVLWDAENDAPDTDHPLYRELPPIDQAVTEVEMVATARPASSESPILAWDVHPATFLRDILDGKFGRLDASGAATWAESYNAADLAALESDTSFRSGRWTIEEPVDDAREWIEKHILLPYGLGWYLDPAGEIRVVDMRRPASSAGAVDITDDDVWLGPGAPSWAHSRGDAVSEVRGTYYLDVRLEDADLRRAAGTYPDLPASLVESHPVPFVVIDLSAPELGGETIELDATPFRAFIDADEAIQRVQADLRKRVQEDIMGPYGDGPILYRLPLRRTTSALALRLGTLARIDIDSLPNPASNLRGGARLCWVTELTDDGPGIQVGLLDLGADTVAVSPTLGTVATTTGREREAVELQVTPNAASDLVELEVAMTTTAVGTRPGEDDSAWQTVDYIDQDMLAIIGGMFAGSRVWVRARSMPSRRDQLRLPSPWVYPSNQYADTDPILAPGGVAVSDVTGGTAEGHWTDTEPGLEVEVLLDGERFALLARGSDWIFLEDLAGSTSYTFGVRYRGPLGQVGPTATAGFTTSGSPPIAPAPIGMHVLIGTRV